MDTVETATENDIVQVWHHHLKIWSVGPTFHNIFYYNGRY